MGTGLLLREHRTSYKLIRHSSSSFHPHRVPKHSIDPMKACISASTAQVTSGCFKRAEQLVAIYRQEDGAALRSYSVMSLRQRGEDPPFDLAHE